VVRMVSGAARNTGCACRLGLNRLAKVVPNGAPSWVLGLGAGARGVDATTGSSKVISTGVTEAGA